MINPASYKLTSCSITAESFMEIMRIKKQLLYLKEALITK